MVRGVVYIAIGQDFVNEALISAQSVKRHNPQLHICLMTDTSDEFGVFDQHIQIEPESHGFKHQIYYLLDSPFQNSLYLDTDTYVDAPITDLFDILDEFDMALCLSQSGTSSELTDVPACFPEFNSGVMLYKKSNSTKALIRRWIDCYNEMDQINRNQPSLRRALYYSDVRLATLRPEWNSLIRYPGVAIGRVKIFHGRLIDLDTPGAGLYHDVQDAAQVINSINAPRVYTQLGGVRVHHNKEDRLLPRLRLSIMRYGYKHAIKYSIITLSQMMIDLLRGLKKRIAGAKK
jgi:hypothetical protein